MMRAHGLTFDLAFTSVLRRAIHTLWLACDEMELAHLPGAVTGANFPTFRLQLPVKYGSYR